MIHHIRPWKLFSLVPQQFSEHRVVELKIPIRRLPECPDYSLKLLELMSLIACIRIVCARNMFEFGTFLGNSTLHMALNSPTNAKVWTLDADDETLKRIGLLDLYRWRSRFPLEFAGTTVESKIRVLRGDSATFDAWPFEDEIDLVLIDGDPERRSDSRKAFSMRPKCILWHDYRNPDWPESERRNFVDYLENLEQDLFHIGDTMLMIYFADPAIVEQLKALTWPGLK